TGPSAPLSARHDAMCAWWCCTPTSSNPPKPPPPPPPPPPTPPPPRPTTPLPGLLPQVLGVLGRQVVRVQVVRDHLGRDVEQPPEVLDALGKLDQGLGVLQVPDVVRNERVIHQGQAERDYQLGAAVHHRAREP